MVYWVDCLWHIPMTFIVVVGYITLYPMLDETPGYHHPLILSHYIIPLYTHHIYIYAYNIYICIYRYVYIYIHTHLFFHSNPTWIHEWIVSHDFSKKGTFQNLGHSAEKKRKTPAAHPSKGRTSRS
jgi:hypothetical protein